MKSSKASEIAALAHSQLCIIYEMLKNKTAFAGLGSAYFENGDGDRLKLYLIARLQILDCKVKIKSDAA
jgi:hypothetical protein